MTKVRDAMTPNPVACANDATLQEVAQKMLDEDTGFIPLVEDGCICGVITDRDIVLRATAKGIDPTKAMAVEYASCGIECVGADASIEEAVQHMENRKIRRLLVVEGNRPIGVVSLGDLAEVAPKQAEDVLVEVSKSQKTLSHGQRQ